MSLKTKWLLYATVGLILSGSGISVIGEAIVVKMQATQVSEWFWLGLLGLVLFHSGLSFFGQASIFRTQMLNQKA
ncbi:MAG: hypothetical protein ACXITV_11265 [Luteibaculaceae bacterium]